MKPLRTLLAVLLLGAPALADAPKKLDVHEWGVFRVNEQVDMANADLRAVWDGLPEFVYGHVRGRQVPLHWGAVEIRDRPILFFHAEGAGQFTVKIDFANSTSNGVVCALKTRANHPWNPARSRTTNLSACIQYGTAAF